MIYPGMLHPIEAICQERLRQDKQWGGKQHDDEHNSADWIGFIEKQIQKCKEAESAEEYEVRMVKVGALAVAAIQSRQRKERKIRAAKWKKARDFMESTKVSK